MSLNLIEYDLAIVNYFKSIFENTINSPPEKALKECAEQSKNKNEIKLPLVSIWRTPSISLSDVINNFAGFRRGDRIAYLEDTQEVLNSRMVGITLEYQLDTWDDNNEGASGLFTELLFRIKDQPKVTIAQKSSDQSLDIFMKVTSIGDLSELLDEEDRGKLYRYFINIEIEATILLDVKSPAVLNIPIKIIKMSDNEELT